MTAGDSSAIADALREPGFYPHRPAVVEVRQTHISWVFLAGDLVYKLKKPLRFRFLDYSTPALRLECCRAEIRLNRRLAPDVYLGVLPILRRGAGFALGWSECDDERAADHLVVMRRLPEAAMLDRRLKEGTAGADDLERVAAKLATFHGHCPDRGSTYGSPERIRETVLGNLAECAPFVGDTLREEERAAIERHARDFLERRAPLLAHRAREGRVREGHGDLRAEHVCLTPAIDIFDCVEFSERLRSVDVACEIAFLAMDLDRLGMPQLADVFVDAYVARTGDGELREVLPVYESYRAMVRGKVESLRSRESEVAAEDRSAAHEAARLHFRLAARYARGARAPELVAVCGLSGTGKSTVARIVAELTGFAIVQSDVLRKDLAGVPRFAHAAGAGASSLYGAESTRRTHEALVRRARETLAGGRGVVIDATFRDPELRRRVVALAAEAGVPLVFLECRAPQDEVQRRLRDRAARNEEASDATVDVYRSQIREGASYDDVPPGAHRVIDTGQSSAAVARALEEIYA